MLCRTAPFHVVVAGALIALVACREAPPAPGTAPRPALRGGSGDRAVRHVVLVTIDTLRADHVGAYGGDVATPRLDRLADQGALVLDASAHVPLTRPSHVSLFAGLLPTETGIRDNVSPAAIPDVPLLAEVFQRAGFETAAFVSAAVVSAASGLDRGFDFYSDDLGGKGDEPRFLSAAQKPGDETLAEAVSWLEERRDSAAQVSRLFLWLHLYDPHEPYEPPEPYASRYPERPYAGEVAWTDELVGRLDDKLGELGLAEETLLVVTSDHGEGLGDHGELLHGFFVYESTLRVPLIVRGPGIVPGARLPGVFGLVDLYPTLLELAGLSPAPGTSLSGRSFAASLRGGPPALRGPLYAESLVPNLRFGWSALRVMRSQPLKYIQAPRPELYDLAADPGEQQNLLASPLSGELRGRFEDLRAALDDHLARERATSTEEHAELPPELREKLRALGYLGGSEAASTTTPGADPKDKIEDFRVANALMREGLKRLQVKDYAGSVEQLRRLREQQIDSAEIRLYLGQALLGWFRAGGGKEPGRLREAADHLLEATRRTPTLVEAWLGLAEARVLLGDSASALETLRDAQAFLPRQVALRREEARLSRMAGDPAGARKALEAALEIAPEDAFLLAALSEVLRDLGDLEGSVERLRQAVEIQPTGASYWNALGMMLGGTGELAEAERAFRQAWRLDATNHRHSFNLGLALLRQGRPDEARPLFEKTLELKPDFRPARKELREIG